MEATISDDDLWGLSMHPDSRIRGSPVSGRPPNIPSHLPGHHNINLDAGHVQVAQVPIKTVNSGMDPQAGVPTMALL